MDLSEVETGALVSAYGVVLGEGYSVATEIVLSDQPYVPGATSVYVSGIPSAVDAGIGRLELGQNSVDFNAALVEGLAPSAGQTIGFVGTQPVAGGLMLATSAIVGGCGN